MILLSLLLLLLSAINAHMQLHSPAPFNASNNPHTTGPPDNELVYPFNCCGRKHEYPCKGYHKLLGTPAGAPTAEWAAGSKQQWSMSGPAPLGANHYGGSCQIGFSTDKGATFRTVVSYEGNCPHRKGGVDPISQVFDFIVPEDLPEGDVLFAWTWINREEEFNMNCAAVRIVGSKVEGSDGKGEGDGVSSVVEALSKTAAIVVSTAEATATLSQQERKQEISTAETAATPTPASPISPPHPHGRFYSKHFHHHPARNSLPVAPRSSVKQGQYSTFQKRATAFSSRPIMFAPDFWNGCTTPRTNAELKYPDPGPEVVRGDGEYPVHLPGGRCGGYDS
ncbi:hypothetical protein EJ08DRAFT_697086 [Tothia fuscella]|uniref:Lytic polysaccharide monooxygenase n=1 Tax=Tothia fuscella TaxID=1048955 RepID=A0A9P4NT27_9PEZI|nr:hypothetical protein EJ08DRAFT_697086 [Tothia fuscella]